MTILGARLPFAVSLMAWALTLTGCVSGPASLSTMHGLSPSAASAGGKAELPPERAGAACLAAARELEDKGYEAEAMDQYERARRYDPHLTAQAARRLAVLYDRQGQDERALAEYQQALQGQAPDARLLNDLGYFHYERGRLTEAEKYLREALQKDPSYRRAWTNLATVLAHEGREEESLAAFGKVVRPPEAFYNLGVLLAKQGKLEAARAALRQALRLEPTLRPAEAFLTALDGPRPSATANATAAAATLSLGP